FYSADTLLKTYPIALGGGGLADKVRRDDRRTPEGDFYVCEMAMHRNPKAWGDVWIQISYPNEEDANRGRRDGIIDASQHSAIHRALQNGDEPPQDTDLGSGIGIHIGGHEKPDWTLRCMALARASGIEIYEQVRIGTPVVISP
ncbi:MAG TPA: L,D-transpeptidase family protein, partial [Armatimonadota bacterium]|nr:L,D-transpeptidase family protein [Armatimonadota bacterium]